MKNHQDLIKYAFPEMYGLPFSTKMPSFLFERNTAWEEERKKLGTPRARGKQQPQQKGRKQSKAVREEMKGLPSFHLCPGLFSLTQHRSTCDPGSTQTTCFSRGNRA